MAYRANGPVTIGDAGKLTRLSGNINLNNVTSAEGDLVYANASNNLVRLPIGAEGDVLSVVAGVPAWGSLPVAESYGFLARKSGVQNILAGVATIPTTIVSWSTAVTPVEYDNTLGAFVGGIFTVSAVGGTGKYLVDANISFQNSSNSGARVVDLYYNGAVIVYRKSIQPSASIAMANQISISTNLRLLVGDTLELRIYRVGGSGSITVDTSPETWFGVCRLAKE